MAVENRSGHLPNTVRIVPSIPTYKTEKYSQSCYNWIVAFL
jgi:hypothetical protein